MPCYREQLRCSLEKWHLTWKQKCAIEFFSFEKNCTINIAESKIKQWIWVIGGRLCNSAVMIPMWQILFWTPNTDVNHKMKSASITTSMWIQSMKEGLYKQQIPSLNHFDWCRFYDYSNADSCLLLTKVSKKNVKLPTLVEGDLKVPFSVATTPKCKGGCYSIPWIAPLYPWSLPYNAVC